LINEKLHRQPQGLDPVNHGGLRVQLPVTDWSVAKDLNAMFVAAVEFGDVCRDCPIVFVRAGKEPDGSDAVAPVAVLGLTAGDNLYVEGQTWRGNYIPAMLRSYPFAIARVNEQRFAVCIDNAYAGLSKTEGQRLFNDLGQPTPMLQEMTQHLETLETEVQRTRLIGKRFMELGLLRDMRFDATLPDGTQHTVDGFLTVDEHKVGELAQEVVMEFHRNGLLGLIHMHWVSMGHMRRLADWHAKRTGVLAADAAAVQTT
jgi:hypothetical protein